MKSSRSVFIHAGLFALSIAFAASVFTRDKSVNVVVHEATIWSGRPAEIERVSFESKGKKVVVEPRKDAEGPWFFGTMETTGDSPSRKAFVSMGSGENLFTKLAPLRALRHAGKVEGADRMAELGLDQPEGSLRVSLASGERLLEIGGSIPGGSDRYARDPSTGHVYVIAGDIARDLEWADSRLLERNLHAFKDADIRGATLSASERARKIVRQREGARSFWADEASAETSDETLGNFMDRLSRLRPSEHLEALPESRTLVVRVEFTGRSGQLGWLELSKVPGEGEEADYYIQSERSRLPGKVVGSLAQQIEQDIGSVLR